MNVNINKNKIITAIMVIVSALAGFGVKDYTDNSGYNPDDPIYKYVPPAEKSWLDKFGDNERTRLIYSMSELRVILNNHGLALQKLIDPNAIKDPNIEK